MLKSLGNYYRIKIYKVMIINCFENEVNKSIIITILKIHIRCLERTDI